MEVEILSPQAYGVDVLPSGISIEIEAGTSGGGEQPPEYDGPTSVTPGKTATTLLTHGKLLMADISVAAVPFRREPNAAGGDSFIIG